MNPFIIETSELTRYFGAKCAVDRVSLRVPRGAVMAVLGRNGSGKTTLIRMILGLLEATRGSATVLGEDSRWLSPGTRGRVAYVAEGHPLIDWMSVADLERFQKGSYREWDGRIFRTVVDHFGLSGRERAGKVSRGQRAGLSLALALATKPDVLVMDDPAMGLDPVARRMLLEAMILLMRDSGHTILFSSHILNDVERVADHVAIMDRSNLRVSCPIETFRGAVKQVNLSFSGDVPRTVEVPGLLETRQEGKELRLAIANWSEQTQKAVEALGAIAVSESPLTFEDAVIAYLGDRQRQVSLLEETMKDEVSL